MTIKPGDQYFDTERETVVNVMAADDHTVLVNFPDLLMAPAGFFPLAEFTARFKPLMVEVPYELVVAVRRVVYLFERDGGGVNAAVERLAELAKDVEWPEEWTT